MLHVSSLLFAGHRLNTVVLRKVYTLSVPECALRCFDDPCCRSANFNKGCLSSERSDNCELLHHVTSDQPGQLMLDENFDHLVLLQPHRVGALFRGLLYFLGHKLLFFRGVVKAEVLSRYRFLW